MGTQRTRLRTPQAAHMIKQIQFLILACCVLFSQYAYSADEDNKITTINLKHIPAEDVISVLKTLIDDSISIAETNNALHIKGSAKKTESILPIITQIDTVPEQLNIEFIASSRKLDFNPEKGSYSTANINKTSQSMVITERQWVTLKTGLSVPVAERKRLADGTETQSYQFKKVSKSYVFKVHEFSGWSVVQVGVDSSDIVNGPVGPIEHTELNTTIVGKTGEWLEVASSRKVTSGTNDKIYTTTSPAKKYIHLYIKVLKPEQQGVTEPATDNKNKQ